MVAPKDITGESFGHLVAIERVGTSKRGRAIWMMKCDCGGCVERSLGNLRARPNASCGCVKTGRLNRGRPPASRTHGMTKTRLHKIWGNMKNRCRNSADYRYRDYGGRGIAVCEEWASSFLVFADWALSHGYRDDLQIDRIDNDGGYSPRNCRWVTPAENMRNQRTTIRYVVGGESLSLTEIAERSGLRKATIRNRIEHIGMTPDEAISVCKLMPGARVVHGRYSKRAE